MVGLWRESGLTLLLLVAIVLVSAVADLGLALGEAVSVALPASLVTAGLIVVTAQVVERAR